LGEGGNWFPGNKADRVREYDLSDCLKRSPHAARIPGYLAEAHEMLKGEQVKRLQEGD
ncbi:MAG TPA: aldo/keto reductase, partial [Candidatus Hydrogenedentes bacterium]|nr:aldo/keto reductase [Candidatus Hydrogenedentota bacterium]